MPVGAHQFESRRSRTESEKAKKNKEEKKVRHDAITALKCFLSYTFRYTVCIYTIKSGPTFPYSVKTGFI